MRRVTIFPCEGETLAGSIDEASGETGLLIVSGGNEVRGGAHRGMASLAGAVATLGFPVFRFDRRGVGDSTGINAGYASSAPDLRAALTHFRQQAPQLRRVVALGNCDAATALALFADTLDIDALVLTNPWLASEADRLPPAAAIRRHYQQRLTRLSTWRDLWRGRIDLPSVAKGLRKLADYRPQRGWPLPDCPVTVVLARDDATAIGFDAAWRTPAFEAWRSRTRVVRLPSGSHSFADRGDALLAAVIAALA